MGYRVDSYMGILQYGRMVIWGDMGRALHLTIIFYSICTGHIRV
jgi:hypothetical protein